MSTRFSRLGPLIGLLVLPFGLVAFASSQSGPGLKSGGRPVIDFYVAHRTGQITSDLAWILAFTCFLLFAGALRGHLRKDPEGETLGALVLARAPATLSPPAAQALNQLGLSMFLPVVSGVLVFGLSTGIAILRTGLLSKVLGAAAILIARCPGCRLRCDRCDRALDRRRERAALQAQRQRHAAGPHGTDDRRPHRERDSELLAPAAGARLGHDGGGPLPTNRPGRASRSPVSAGGGGRTGHRRAGRGRRCRGARRSCRRRAASRFRSRGRGGASSLPCHRPGSERA